MIVTGPTKGFDHYCRLVEQETLRREFRILPKEKWVQDILMTCWFLRIGIESRRLYTCVGSIIMTKARRPK